MEEFAAAEAALTINNAPLDSVRDLIGDEIHPKPYVLGCVSHMLDLADSTSSVI